MSYTSPVAAVAQGMGLSEAVRDTPVERDLEFEALVTRGQTDNGLAVYLPPKTNIESNTKPLTAHLYINKFIV